MRFLWAFLGLACVGLALVGVVLPLLPTVPFLLLAAFFFARSSERLHYWLLSHSTFGPLIDDWHSRGAIRPRAAYSGVIRPPVPIVSGHPFRFDPAGDSGASGHPHFGPL